MPTDLGLPASPIAVAGFDRAIADAAEHVRFRWGRVPPVGIILGTGFGKFSEEIDAELTLPYAQIPHFPGSTTLGHRGRLICGTVKGVPVVAMEGRCHFYEGHPAWQISLPVRVMRRLGIELLLVSNAAGGLNPQYRVGDMVAIADHINLTGANPLGGASCTTRWQRRPDFSRPYDEALIGRAEQIARQHDFVCHRGVYIALSGPNYETRAEYRCLRTLGGDVVGMSTVPEVVVAKQLGLRILAISTVTNVCRPDALGKTDAQMVVEAATHAETRLRAIVLGIINDTASGAAEAP